MDKLENRIKKNRWHIARLEQVLKLMENDDLEPSKIDRIKEDVEYYIESAADDDGSTGVDDEFDIYEELALDSFVASIDKLGIDETAPSLGAAAEVGEPSVSLDSSPKPVEVLVSDEKSAAKKVPAASILGIAAIGKPQPAALAKSTPTPGPASKATPAAGAKVVTSPSPAIGTKAPVATALSATGATGVASATTANRIGSGNAQALTAAAIVAGGNSAAVVSTTPSSTPVLGTKSEKKPPKTIAEDHLGGEEDTGLATSWASAAAGFKNASILASSNPSTNSASKLGGVAPVTPQEVLQPQQGPAILSGGAPSGPSPPLAAPGSTSYYATTRAPPPPTLSSEVLIAAHMLKQSFLHTPEAIDPERQPTYIPRTPFSTHPSFPLKPPSTSELQSLYDRLPLDSLFFAFYYMQGTYQQFLAAKTLKKQSWRFHKKYMTWFQRHEEPKIATDEYEEGTYVYFDFETNWCQLIKHDFKFEFIYLEDELVC